MEFIEQVFARIGEIKAKMRAKESRLGGGGKMIKDLNLSFKKVLEGVGSGARVGKRVGKVDRGGLGISAGGKEDLLKGHLSRSSGVGELVVGKGFKGFDVSDVGLNNLLLNKYNDYKRGDILLKEVEGEVEVRGGGKKVDIKF